ncbi:hypothetical protein AAC387_Pa02g1131 [Persea americana]
MGDKSGFTWVKPRPPKNRSGSKNPNQKRGGKGSQSSDQIEPVCELGKKTTRRGAKWRKDYPKSERPNQARARKLRRIAEIHCLDQAKRRPNSCRNAKLTSQNLRRLRRRREEADQTKSGRRSSDEEKFPKLCSCQQRSKMYFPRARIPS